MPPAASTTADTMVRFATVDSPVGPLLLAADADALVGLWFLPNGEAPARRDPRAALAAGGARPDDGSGGGASGVLAQARAELADYFAGRSRAFAVPLAPRGTEFQRRVWAALCEIPHGATISYAELARRIGRPTAVRAVGLANGANPLAVVVPCHRVVGADGSLTGYGGGLKRKRWLLAHEGAAAELDLR